MYGEHEAASAYPAPYAVITQPLPRTVRAVVLLVNEQFVLGQKLRNNSVVALILIQRTVSIAHICISAPGVGRKLFREFGRGADRTPKGKFVLLNDKLQRYSCAQELRGHGLLFSS